MKVLEDRHTETHEKNPCTVVIFHGATAILPIRPPPACHQVTLRGGGGDGGGGDGGIRMIYIYIYIHIYIYIYTYI